MINLEFAMKNWEVDGDSRHEWIAIYKIFKQKFFIQDHRTKQVYVTVYSKSRLLIAVFVFGKLCV